MYSTYVLTDMDAKAAQGMVKWAAGALKKIYG